MAHTYYLPAELVKKIKERAEQQERSESFIVRFALIQFFKSLEGQDGTAN
jgi:predicted transcriptional regulator